MTTTAITTTEALVLQAAANGDIAVQQSTSYDDGKPPGWDVYTHRGVPVDDRTENAIMSLLDLEYLDNDGCGPLRLTVLGAQVTQ